MCLIENKVKPKGDIFYKVFALRYNKLCWFVRGLTGGHSLGKEKVIGNKFESTEEGFHVWRDLKSARKFAKLMPKLLPGLYKNVKTVVKKVKCSKLIKSGTCIVYVKDYNVSFFFDEETTIREQSFAFNVMEVVE